MDRSVLARLEKLEQRIDIGDVRTASTDALLAFLADLIGREPTLVDLKKMAAGEPVEGKRSIDRALAPNAGC